jgi:hypothetical protein
MDEHDLRRLLAAFNYLTNSEFELRIRADGKCVLKCVSAGGGPTLKFKSVKETAEYLREECQ